MHKKFLILFLVAVLFASGFAKAVQVPLTIKETAGIQRLNEPVTSGVPLPQGVIFSDQSVKIQGVDGQFKTLATWPDGSVKWLLCDFQANVAANGITTYYLVDGSGNALGSPLAELTSPNLITVNTGSLKFTINKAKFNIFDEVWVDLNNDNIFSAGEKIISSNNNAGAIINDNDGKTYKSTLSSPTSFVIEENGPLKTVILISGRHTASDGTLGMYYTTRIYAYKGKTYVKVRHSYANGKLISSWTSSSSDTSDDETTNSINLEFVLDLSGTKDFILARDVGTANIAGTLSGAETAYIQQDNTGAISVGTPLQYTSNIKGTVTTVNGKAEGWSDLSDTTKGLTTSLKHFWQKYTKRMTVTGDAKVIVGLSPIPDTLRETVGVGDEIMFYFHGADKSQITNLVNGFNKNPLFAVAPNTWYINSKAFGILQPYPSINYPNFDALIAMNYDIFYTEQAGGLYGDTNFGDAVFPKNTVFWSSGTPADNLDWGSNYYDGIYQMIHQFARTADYKYLRLASEVAQHFIETDIYNIYPESARYGPGCTGSCSGDFNPMRGLCVAYKGSHRDDPHYVHIFQEGPFYYYYLTGDRRALEQSLIAADSVKVKSVTDSSYGLCDSGRSGYEHQSLLLQAYLATKDQTYLDRVKAAADTAIQTLTINNFPNKAMRQESGMYVPVLYNLYKETNNVAYRDTIIRIADWLMTPDDADNDGNIDIGPPFAGGYIGPPNYFYNQASIYTDENGQTRYWATRMEIMSGFGFAYLASGDVKYLNFVKNIFNTHIVDQYSSGVSTMDAWTKASGQAFRNTIHLQGILEAASFHPADTNQNGIIEMKELIAFIGKWKSGQANVNDIMSALDRWMRGN